MRWRNRFGSGVDSAAFTALLRADLGKGGTSGSRGGGNKGKKGQPKNPAVLIAEEALEDGVLSIFEANEIWRANTEVGFAVFENK